MCASASKTVSRVRKSITSVRALVLRTLLSVRTPFYSTCTHTLPQQSCSDAVRDRKHHRDEDPSPQPTSPRGGSGSRGTGGAKWRPSIGHPRQPPPSRRFNRSIRQRQYSRITPGTIREHSKQRSGNIQHQRPYSALGKYGWNSSGSGSRSGSGCERKRRRVVASSSLHTCRSNETDTSTKRIHQYTQQGIVVIGDSGR